MRDYEVLDPNLFKAFVSVFENQSFTVAAAKCSMTQSGVSQHIARLEKQIGTPLFKRANNSIFPTDAAHLLKGYVEDYSERLEIFLDKVRHEESRLSGVVRYAMPQSCLFTPHFGLLLEERSRSFPGVDIQVTIAPNGQIFQMLLADQIDFGFVTDRFDNAALRFIPFCKEEYVLVSKNKRDLSSINAETIKSVPFISFPGMDVYFSFWRERFFPKAKTLSAQSLKVGGSVSTLDGVLTMVRSGLGMTILPKQCVDAFVDAGELQVFQSSSGAACFNQIYIVKLEAKQYPRRVQAVIQTFVSLKK